MIKASGIGVKVRTGGAVVVPPLPVGLSVNNHKRDEEQREQIIKSIEWQRYSRP
jgi:hypothetical protein